MKKQIFNDELIIFDALNNFSIEELIPMISGNGSYTGDWEFILSFSYSYLAPFKFSITKFSENNFEVLYQYKNLLYAMVVKFFPLIKSFIRNNEEFKLMEDPKYSTSKFWSFLLFLKTVYDTELPEEWRLYIDISQ